MRNVAQILFITGSFRTDIAIEVNISNVTRLLDENKKFVVMLVSI